MGITEPTVAPMPTWAFLRRLLRTGAVYEPCRIEMEMPAVPMLGALVLDDLRLHGMTPLPFSINEGSAGHRAYVDVGQTYFAQVTFIP